MDGQPRLHKFAVWTNPGEELRKGHFVSAMQYFCDQMLREGWTYSGVTNIRSEDIVREDGEPVREHIISAVFLRRPELRKIEIPDRYVPQVLAKPGFKLA